MVSKVARSMWSENQKKKHCFSYSELDMEGKLIR